MRPLLRSTTVALFSVAFLLALWPASVRAQGPDVPWRTFETPHYRIHYPAPAEPWARAAAERLESIRERVTEEVGYRPTEITDVLVSDPISRANGTAWPILGWPRMVLWTSPPGPDSVIGFYRDWRDILLVHEDTHLAHMLRPSRNPLSRRLAKVSRSGPVMVRSPRWVLEGYATLLEGQLTASGRPQGDLRATILRRWAQLGELPSYGRLEGGAESWYGLSMAYLVGSAFLEWLVEREGPEALRDLWSRLSARQNRSFDEAFTGALGDPPAKLYNRFRAELTYRAMRLEEILEPQLRGGEVWQELRWTTGAPALSPDGRYLALVLRSRRDPSRLVVWSTGPPEEEEKRWQEHREALQQRDPDDVPAVRRSPLPRKPVAQWTVRDGAESHDPRWVPGLVSTEAPALLFWRNEPDGDGFLRPDLFFWHPDLSKGGKGRVERLTRGAAVREADPAPGGRRAVAVRQRWGASQLVAVDLQDGGVEPLTDPTIEVVFHHPRISPDGRWLAVVAHREGAWRLELHPLRITEQGIVLEGGPRRLELPPDAMVAHPAWGPEGKTLYAAVGEAGLIDLRVFVLDPLDQAETVPGPAPVSSVGVSHRLTTSLGAALAPAPAPDGRSLFYLGLEADGLDVRRLDLGDETSEPMAPAAELDAKGPGPPIALTPVLRPDRPEPPSPFEHRPIGEGRAYGLGRLEILPLLGGSWRASEGHLELGARGGDVVGRFDLLALVASGEALDGGALAGSWRGWPVELGLRLFDFEVGQQETAHRGIELSASWDHHSRRRYFSLGGGVSIGRSRDGSASRRSIDREQIFLASTLFHQRELGTLRLASRLDLRWDLGESDAAGWQRWGGALELGAALRDGPSLWARWQQRDSDGLDHDFDRFQLGGLDSSLWSGGLRGGRIFVPALPSGFLLGDRAESLRLALRHGRWPIELFVERHRLADHGIWGPWIDLRGVELRLFRSPQPLLRLPALELRLGLAELVDGLDRVTEGGPENGDIEGWLSLTWRP